MGKKLDALLGKFFKTSKFKAYVNLAVSRIGFLKMQHHVRWSQARSDVLQLLTLGHQETALLRVEHVVREQNMLDVFVIIEGYCRLLIERMMLIKNSKTCPDELKEAISSLIFAASRYGRLPELQKIRGVFTSKFGKEFDSCAVELRNNCGVNPKIVKKLPIRRPSLGTKLKVLKEIAAENGGTLFIEGQASEVTEEKMKRKESTKFSDPKVEEDGPGERKRDKKFSSFMKARKKYGDVATAAQEAFVMASHAAAAARAAIELSQIKLHKEDEDEDDDDDDDQNTGTRQEKFLFNLGEFGKSELRIDECAASKEIHAIDFSPKSIDREIEESKHISHTRECDHSYMKAAVSKVSSASSSDYSGDIESDGTIIPSYIGGQNQLSRNESRRVGDNDEKGEKQDTIRWFESHDFDKKSSFFTNEIPKTKVFNAEKDEGDSNKEEEEEDVVLNYQSPKRWASSKARPDPVEYSVEETRSVLGSTYLSDSAEKLQSNRGRRPISVRTRRTLKSRGI